MSAGMASAPSIVVATTLAAVAVQTVLAQTPGVELIFEAADSQLEAAAMEYTSIWAADGDRIIAALERHTGLDFHETEIRVVVIEGPSGSGFGPRPMRMRASYPPDTKRGTLIHELGHRLQGHLFRRDDEDHPFLFLYLYDVWVSLYGAAFADAQVQVESGRRGLYDYEAAWREALALSAEERAERWRELIAAGTRVSGYPNP